MVKILLVEDDEMICDMLSRRLEGRGYKVLIAVDGEQGIELANTRSPDIIIMDMSLPVMDGWEASRRLKAESATSSIPIIGLSAHVLTEYRDRAIAAGCDDFEIKPIEFDRLLEKILLQLGV